MRILRGRSWLAHLERAVIRVEARGALIGEVRGEVEHTQLYKSCHWLSYWAHGTESVCDGVSASIKNYIFRFLKFLQQFHWSACLSA